jgi:hypothetical protein
MVEAEDLKLWVLPVKLMLFWSLCFSDKNLPPAVLTGHTEEQLFPDHNEPPTKTGNLYKI